jgi:DNA-binding CsgD family transcriptional regulator
MTTEHELIELGYQVSTPSALRERALELLCPIFEAEVGVFVALEGGREVRALRGWRGPHGASLDAAWQAVRGELQPVRAKALRDGVATDRRVLGTKLWQTTLFHRVMAPLGGTETLVVIPRLAGRALGMVAFGRCGGSFPSRSIAHARSLVPALSVAIGAAATSSLPAFPQLTASELDLLDYLELGWGAREMAEARGTSFFTVRNQLSALYRKLEVANRTEAVGLRRGVPRAQ